MPINYKNYPPNWKSEIRPAVLERAGNKCETCGVKNHDVVFRGLWQGKEAFQDIDGNAWYYPSGEPIKGPDCYNMIDPLKGDENQLAIKIVLTIAHLDHNIENNSMGNLKAMCQKCHLNYDKQHHAHNAKQTRNNKKGLQEIQFNG